VATLDDFSPAWGTPEEWDRAFEQVDNYLRAYRLPGRWRRAQWTAALLARAAAAPPPGAPSVSPTAAAIAATDAALTGWFRALLPETAALADDDALVTGRLALLLCDGCPRWPDAFLRPDPPDEFPRALRGAVLKAGPDLRKGRMVPRPRDWGLVADWAGGTLHSLDRRPYLRALLSWLLLAVVLGYLFHITRL